MDFIHAVMALSRDSRVLSSIEANGEREELVLINDTPFIKAPRSIGAKSDNYVFSSPSMEEILDDGWEVL